MYLLGKSSIETGLARPTGIDPAGIQDRENDEALNKQ
jgi:hypothetical protein